jgi:hypothetical protein
MKTKQFIAGLLIVALAFALLWFTRSTTPQPVVAARSQTPASLPRELRPAREAMELSNVSTEPATNASPTSNLTTRLQQGEPPKLTSEQIAPFLAQNHRNAASLLAAYRATGDRAYLLEAMERFPKDPGVALLAFYRGIPSGDLRAAASEQRRQWLETFQQAAPDNALADYLSAFDHFKAGQPDLAAQEVLAGAGKPGLQDYLVDQIQNTEEAYRAAGYSEAEAKAYGMSGMRVTHLTELNLLGGELIKLARSYQQAGDNASANAAFQMAIQLSERLGQPGSLTVVPTYASINIQREVLKSMDPNSVYGSNGQTVQDQLNALNERLATLKDIGKQAREILPSLTDQDLISYFDRTTLFGEEAAQRWLVSKYAAQ